MRRSIERIFQAHRIDLVEGKGRLIDPNRIEVEKDGLISLVEAEKVVIATGSQPASLTLFSQESGVFLADEMLDITYLPAHLLVVGGGAIGVEMASIFRELGTQVTLVELKSRLLPSEDAEMSDYLQSVLRRRKVKVICGIGFKSAVREVDKFNVQLSDGTTSPDTVLLAVGRLLNTEGIGLKEAGVSLSKTM